ncbi:MAG: flap endonuclease [Acidimicrobiia bacterium]|nr:flap endonuclease [Acidimicrobiia bacterium]
MRLHLLDATYELFRAFYGPPGRFAPDGLEVGAIAGLLETTFQLLHEPGVTHVAAATDTIIESFRNDMYDGYKTGEGIEPELWAQFPLAERALEAAGVVVWRMEEFEADDALATAALKYVDDVDQVIICTPDKDAAQCVLDRKVVMLDRRRQVVIDEEGVWEKWGVGPVSIPDYLALVGDAADGIPGITGWGAKSSSKLLARYTRLDDIPADESEWEVTVRGAARLGANLRANLDDALLFRTLTTLRRDVPLPESFDDLEWKGARRVPFLELCEELGFDGLKDRPRRWQD